MAEGGPPVKKGKGGAYEEEWEDVLAQTFRTILSELNPRVVHGSKVIDFKQPEILAVRKCFKIKLFRKCTLHQKMSIIML